MKRGHPFWVITLAALAMLLCRGAGVRAQESQVADSRVIASCDFEGPYSTGAQQIQEGCVNNWQWGKKDMLLRAETDSGRPGIVQSIQVRGISSGGMQFFFTKLTLKQDCHYRVSWWMKGDGVDCPVAVYIRKIGYPWSVYVRGWSGVPGNAWEQHSFTGKSTADVSEDLGLMWETGTLGKVWLDDVLIEELPGPPAPPVAASPPPGNLLLRSSCEGFRDYLWCGGVYAGPAGEWEDPQPYRAEGGKFGRYAMAIPASTKGGRSFCRSAGVAVVPGHPYTFSAWLKADKPGTSASLGMLPFAAQQGIAAKHVALTPEWQRFSVTGVPDATPTNQVVLGIHATTPDSVVYADGLQLEAGDAPTDYRPRYPLELYADVGQAGGNLFEWGQAVPLTVYAAAAAEHAPGPGEDGTAGESRSSRKSRIEITVTGHPDVEVWQKTATIPVNEPVRFKIDLKRRGIFRVSLRTVNRQDAAPQEMLFALLPPPRPTGAESLFGTHLTIRPFFLDYAHRFGIKWVRFHDACVITKWSSGEPEPGKYQWFDEQVDAIRARGLHILALPDHPPKWAQTEKGKGDNVIEVPAFAAYCEAAARHYRGRISHWEIWNEPYMSDGFFCGGTAPQFAQVAKAAYPALKRGNPEATVLGYCVDIAGPDYLRKVFADAGKSFDVFSFHNYVTNLTGGGTLPFAGELAEHRKILGDQDPGEYWNTEGTNAEVGGCSFYTFMPATRAMNERATAFASRVWVEHAKAGINKFFVYTTHQTDTAMYYGSKLYIGYDRSVTPAVVATAVTAYCIDGLKSVPCAETPGVVQGLFTGDDRATWVVYDDSGTAGRGRLDLRKLPRAVELLDVMGNDPRRSGVKTWEIGMQPLFVMSSTLTAADLAAAATAALRE
jgi:hypothetical protein